MNDSVTRKPVRRRRSWYRRRLRIRRMLMATSVAAVIALACWQNAARYLSLPTLHASQMLPDSFWVRQNIHKEMALMAARSAKPVKPMVRGPRVYAYSVIPGGLKDASDLRYAASRDYVVRRHYTHFDFDHARLIRAKEAREVYLSYRIRDTVYWTRRKIRLHLGELLLTDGNITARARCGNQISDTAKPDVSNEEPDQDVLDRPVAALEPGPSFPVRPMLASPDLPAGEPNPPTLFANSFFFPYVPSGVPLPPGLCRADGEDVNHRCPHHKPPATPEPSTLILIGSGLMLILWRCRKMVRPVAA